MASEPDSLVVAGEKIREGTSLFHEGTSRIMWVEGVENDSVVLDSLEGTVEMPAEEFRQQLRSDKLLVGSQPPGFTE